MTADSLAKLSVNAAKMTLTFNAKTRWVDVDFNKNATEDAYGTCIRTHSLSLQLFTHETALDLTLCYFRLL